MEVVKKESDFNMFDWWKKVFIENYANFEGRARRSEYWYFSLVNFLCIVPLFVLMGILAARNEDSPIFMILIIIAGLIALSLLIPSIAVAVRRLHDTGKSGWWYLLGVIPVVNYIGGIILLVFYCTDGEMGDNKYGPDPKQID